jgi:xylan 1,4-beta-xylosidase
MTRFHFFAFIILGVCLPPLLVSGETRTSRSSFQVDASEVVGDNHEFWKAIGYDFLFKIVNEPEGQEFLDRAAASRSVRYYRTHYTFNNATWVDHRAGGKVGGQSVHLQEDGTVRYDFSIVNKTFREYVKRGMKPIVEFSLYPDGFAKKEARNDESFGAPSGPPKDWDLWQEVLHRFMQNLVEEFGHEELKTWYFEVWNEPDHWSKEEMPDFFKLYDMFAHTVKSYSPEFRVGGPACYHMYFMRDFLEHVVNGTNYMTGEKGSPVDFLSYHIYGLSGSWLKPAPDIFPQVSKFSSDVLWWQRLLRHYPALKDVEIHLNEWGLSSHGDSKFVNKFPQLEYRNSEVSALFLVKLVDCLYAIEDHFDFRTDLMLYWGSWFNAASGDIFLGSRDLMTSGGIPKPILTGYEMLAKLGAQRLKTAGPKPGGRLGVIATKSKDQLQFIAYNFNETDDPFTARDAMHIHISNLSGFAGKRVRVSEYDMDQNHHNTYRKWVEMGRPDAAEKSVIPLLKKAGNLIPTHTSTVEVQEGSLSFDYSLKRHTMKLVIVELDNEA